MDEKKPETGLVPSAGAQGVMAITGGSTPMPLPEEFAALTNAAAWIFRSKAFPQYRSAEEVFVGMLFVREMGVNLTMGLSKGYAIHGKFDIEAKVKLAAIKARVPGFQYQFLVSDAKKCVFRARLLPTDEFTETSYTIEKAMAAGLMKEGGAWTTYPEEMLQWRAVSRWLNLYAGHVLYTLPTLVAQDALAGAVEIETEDVTDQSVGAAPPAKPAPARPEEPNWKTEFARIAAAQAYPRGEKRLELFNLIMREDLGRQPIRKPAEAGIQDWKDVVGAMRKRGWDKEGTGTATEAAREPTQPPQEPVRGFKEQAADTRYGPGPDEVIQHPDNVPEDDERGEMGEDEPETPVGVTPLEFPAPEPERYQGDTMMEGVKRGAPLAISDLGLRFAKQLAREDIVREFINLGYGGQGHTWFVDTAILKACGATRTVEGKQTAVPVLLSCPPASQYERLLASEGLCQMIGQKLWDEYEEFQAKGKFTPGVLPAKQAARLEGERRGS
jgi:hypothetical protein